MLTPAMIRLLRELEPETSLAGLSRRIGISGPTARRQVDSLIRLGLVERADSRNGPVRWAMDRIHAMELRTFIHESPSIAWEDVITNSSFDVLAALGSRDRSRRDHDGTTPTAISRMTGLSRVSVHKSIDHLKRNFIVSTKKGTYRVLPGRTDLVGMIDSLSKHHAYACSGDIVPNPRLLWSLGSQYLIEGDRTIQDDSHIEAGLDTLPYHGFPIITHRHHSIRTRREMSVSDHICHILLSGHGNTRFAVLLYIAKRPDSIVEKASIYGIEGLVEEMLRYVVTRGVERTGILPTWDAIESLADQYGVGI